MTNAKLLLTVSLSLGLALSARTSSAALATDEGLRDAVGAVSVIKPMRPGAASLSRPLSERRSEAPSAGGLPVNLLSSRQALLLAAWQDLVRGMIESRGGFEALPGGLAVSLKLRLDLVQGIFWVDEKGELFARPERFDPVLIAPIQRYFQNSLRNDPTIPKIQRDLVDQLHYQLARSLHVTRND